MPVPARHPTRRPTGVGGTCGGAARPHRHRARSGRASRENAQPRPTSTALAVVGFDAQVSADVLESRSGDGPAALRRRRVTIASAIVVALVLASLLLAREATAGRRADAVAVAAASTLRVAPAGYGPARVGVRVDNPSDRPVRVASVTVTLGSPAEGASATGRAAGVTIGAGAFVIVRVPFDAAAGCQALLAGDGVVRLRVRLPSGRSTEVGRGLPRFPDTPLGAAWETALGVFRCA